MSTGTTVTATEMQKKINAIEKQIRELYGSARSRPSEETIHGLMALTVRAFVEN